MRLQTPRKGEGRKEGGKGRRMENRYSPQGSGCLWAKVLIPPGRLFLV